MNNTAVQKLNESIETPKKLMSIEELIQQSAKQLGMALPSHMRPERIVRIALTTLRMNPKLYECNPKSILAALFQSAQLGLEPNLNGEAWIIPYKTKSGMMAQFQIGAYGLVKLFWNHMNSISLQVESVHEKDFFEYDLGSANLKHIPPPFGKERGAIIGYYAYAVLSNGGRSIKVMSKEEVLTHAERFSKCWNKNENNFMSGTPWQSHFDAMAHKTVLVKLMKLLPKSVELQKAISMDETIKTDVDADMSTVGQTVDYTEILSPDENTENGLSAMARPANGHAEVVTEEAQTSSVPLIDILESQLSELEIKGTREGLMKWYNDNSEDIESLTGKDKVILNKEYSKILKTKE